MIGTSSLLALGGPAGDAFVLGVGVAVVVLLLGGPILLRFQRQRQQFLLTKAAIDRGVTTFPSGPPAWLQSTRNGVILLALGLSILVCGGVSVGLSKTVPMPEKSVMRTPPMPMPNGDDAGPDLPRDGGPPGGMLGRPGDGPPNRRLGMDGPRGGRMGGPGDPPERGDDRQGPPPPIDPAMERWRQARAESMIAHIAMAAGVVLSVMGIARLMVARIERRYEPVVDPIATTL